MTNTVTKFMSSQIYENGRPTENTSRAEGFQAEQRQDNLQQQAREADGSSTRKARDYIVSIENGNSCHKPFVVKEVKTAKEVFEQVCDWYPSLCHPSILMRVSDTRVGSMHRVFYEQELPVHTDSLYIHLYLRKHTPFYGGKN